MSYMSYIFKVINAFNYTHRSAALDSNEFFR